jgi:hypothetical protein
MIVQSKTPAVYVRIRTFRGRRYSDAETERIDQTDRDCAMIVTRAIPDGTSGVAKIGEDQREEKARIIVQRAASS